MKLTALALKESRLTLLIVIFAAAAGLVALIRLPRSEDPPFIFRYALIQTYYPGASAERVETLLTRRIEEAVQQVQEVEFINSISRTHASVIIIKLKDEFRRLQPIWDRLRRKIESIRSELPEGIKGPVFDDEFGQVFGIILTIGSKRGNRENMVAAADSLHGELMRLEEVAKVEFIGKSDDYAIVEYDDEQMAEAGFSPLYLKLFLESQNFLAPGGSIKEGSSRVLVAPVDYFESVADIDSLPVVMPDTGETYYLGELMTIERRPSDPPVSLVRTSGVPGIGLAIALTEGGNITKLGREVQAAVQSIEASLPDDVIIEYTAFEPERVESKLRRFFISLIFSLLVVMVILVVSLGMRTGSLIASVIPLVMLTALAMMLILGLDLNQVVLAAFVVVLGILVDNHIVVAERILTLTESGSDPSDAALSATSELFAPLLVAVFCTIAGFLPLFLARSAAAEYASPLFLVVGITLLCSQTFCFTVTPCLAARFMSAQAAASQPQRARIYRNYRSLLLFLLRHRSASLLLLLIVFLAAAYSFRFLPKIFFPPSDRPIFTLAMEFPAGTSIEHTHEAATKFDSFIREEIVNADAAEPGIVTWTTFIGRNAPRFILNHQPRLYSPELAYVLFNVTDIRIIPLLRQRLGAFCRENFPRALVRIRELEAAPAIGFPIKVRVAGKDIEGIFAIVAEIKAKLASLNGVHNINDDWGPKTKSYRIVVDDESAIEAGITHTDIAVAAQSVLTGLPAGSLRGPDREIPIRLRADVPASDALHALSEVNVYSRVKQTSMRLGKIASIDEISGPATILRRDHMRTVTVQADIGEGVIPQDVDRVLEPWMAEQQRDWGPAYQVTLAGEGDQSRMANRSILEQLPWTGFIILLLLVKQMRSFRRTAIIMCAVPMGIVGVVAGLFLTGQPFGFMTLIGMVSLSGIVVNSAIILVDRIRLNTERGGNTPQACIVDASLSRLRPILLTTLTTIGGIMPLYLKGSPIWQPMTVSLIFGLLFSTILVLGFLPVMYAVVFRVRFDEAACREIDVA